MSLISVIVPVYKVEAYIHRCINSILSQTFSDFDLILVNDGSPDNCGSICDEYAEKDKRIHVIHQANSGLSAARNVGIDWAFANSNSKYLTFIDSDDWVHPKYLEYLYHAISDYGNGISVCKFKKVDTYFIQQITSDVKLIEWSFEDFICTIESGFSAVNAWGKLFKKEYFGDIRFPVGKINEDLFTIHKVIYKCDKIVGVEESLYYYYQSNDSIMRQVWSSKRLDEIEASKEYLEFMCEHKLNKAKERAIKRYYNVISRQLKEIEAYNGKDGPKYRKKLEYLRKYLVFSNLKVFKLTKNDNTFKNVFPKVNWLYWTIIGITNKFKRIIKNNG